MSLICVTRWDELGEIGLHMFAYGTLEIVFFATVTVFLEPNLNPSALISCVSWAANSVPKVGKVNFDFL